MINRINELVKKKFNHLKLITKLFFCYFETDKSFNIDRNNSFHITCVIQIIIKCHKFS